MDIILGFVLQDSVLIATSQAATRGVTVFKGDDDKTCALSDHTLLAFTGEAGDTLNFAEYINANMRLNAIRLGREYSPKAIASFLRNSLAEALRSRKPYQVNMLLAGYDPKAGPSLNWIDYLAANVPLKYGAHGYAAYYVMSTLDRHWTANLTREEGLELLDKCVKELKKRLPIDFKSIQVKFVGKDGIELGPRIE